MKFIGFISSSIGWVSVGVMVEGEYIFGIVEFEEMMVVSGVLKVLLLGIVEWKVYIVGEVFNVFVYSEFYFQVVEFILYLCCYL